MCVEKADECTDDVKGIVKSVVELAVVIAASTVGDIDVEGIIKDMGGAALSLAYGMCENPSNIFTA